MKIGEIKYKYSIKVLEERLDKERKHLKIFQRPTEYLDWQKTNIDTCLYRINEIEQAIVHMKGIEL